jgi:UDP-glucuronate 4-epimerase
MKILITGVAGFIGFHLANRLINEGHEITGLDNINDYYDINLKYARLNLLGIPRNEIKPNIKVASKVNPSFCFFKMDIQDKNSLEALFKLEKIDVVCNLAAQAGVRYSIENPGAYIGSNITGFINILEACRHYQIKHLVYASSSSVYGLNKTVPFSEKDNVDHPVSLYAATKKSNELMAHTYSYLYGLPTTGLRFFTVYGPWGRPDMALFIFTKAIFEGKTIQVYNNGDMERDFTYIDDIIEGIYLTITRQPKGDSGWNGYQPDPSFSVAPYRLFNIGNNTPVKLMDFVNTIEKITGKTASIEYMPLQPGDVCKTWANIDRLKAETGYIPSTNIEAGINQFINWFKKHYAYS